MFTLPFSTRPSRPVLLLAMAAIGFGCAQGGGGGRPDAGTTPTIDAGDTPGVDGGETPDTDAGDQPPIDASPLTDAGMIGDDASMVVDASMVDGGEPMVDAGTDAGPPPECATAADCDDMNYCNGIERCEGGRCEPGVPFTCDDGLDCTVNTCIEPESGTVPTCEHTPDDSLCPAGEECTASGCVPICPESPCRLLTPQCGCDAGDGCYLSSGTRQCQAAGSATEGTACTATNACAPGLACLNMSSDPTIGLSQCSRLCGSDADCVGSGSLCILNLSDGMGGALPDVRSCTRSCNPVNGSGCRTGTGCHVYRESEGAMRGLTHCAGPTGSGTTYASCTSNAGCQRNYLCIDVGFGNECLHYCRSTSDCPGVTSCTLFPVAWAVDGVRYGYCD